MTGASWITMITITGSLSGGFALVPVAAIRNGSGKTGDE